MDARSGVVIGVCEEYMIAHWTFANYKRQANPRRLEGVDDLMRLGGKEKSGYITRGRERTPI